MENNCCDSSQGPQCCASGESGSACGPTGRAPRWKAVVFIVVMLAAVAVAAHALMTGPSASVGADGKPAGPAGEPTSLAPESAEPGATTGGEEAGLDKTDEALAGDESAFVIVRGPDGPLPEEVSAAVAGAQAKIEDKGVEVALLTLSPGDSGYREAVSRFGIDSFPAVVVMMKGCSNVVVMGSITETGLLSAYVEASMNPTACETDCAVSCE